MIINLPPLRERQEDIPLLVERFLQDAINKGGKHVELTPAALQSLTTYHWPGNVRELENLVERLVVFSRGQRVDIADLPQTITPRPPALEKRLFDDLPTLDELERRYLLHVLQHVGNNRTRAAEVMGIDRRTLYRMAERFGIPLEYAGSGRYAGATGRELRFAVPIRVPDLTHLPLQILLRHLSRRVSPTRSNRRAAPSRSSRQTRSCRRPHARRCLR